VFTTGNPYFIGKDIPMKIKRLLKIITPTLFWRFQIIGWLCFDVVYVVVFSPKFLDSWRSFLPVPLNTAYGMLLTGLMRLIYMRLQRRKAAPTTLAVSIFLVSFVAAILWESIDWVMTGWLWGHSGGFSLQRLLFVTVTDTSVMFAWSLLYFSLKLWLDWNEEKKRSAGAVKLAREAQMQLLRYQLNPHFLFNSLNSIRTLVDENPALAKQIITELAEFFRYSLVNRDVLFVPLRDEINAVRHYFAIQRTRYEDQLETAITVSPEAESFPVLSFMVHPLIENAVKYGMQTSAMPLRISLTAEVSGDTLQLTIVNSGSWIEPEPGNPAGTGTGLNNVRKLLENAYPHSHTFEITPGEDEVRVAVHITRTTGTV
jgi:hypothetical protein